MMPGEAVAQGSPSKPSGSPAAAGKKRDACAVRTGRFKYSGEWQVTEHAVSKGINRTLDK
jgi:hypothetical protein